MERSFNCCVLPSGDTSKIQSFPFKILSENNEKFVNIKEERTALDVLTVGHIREFMCPKIDVSDMRDLILWKVNVKKQVIKDKISTEEDIKKELNGEEMESEELFESYFQNELGMDEKNFTPNTIHILAIIPATAGKCLPIFYLSTRNFALKQVSPFKALHKVQYLFS